MFESNNKNSVSQHGRDLSVQLERDIQNEDPLLFVVHSLGGIIVKDALRRSQHVRSQTRLVVFLGTPHRGSNLAAWGVIASRLTRLALRDSNTRIIETLNVNGEVLDNIQEEFRNIVLRGEIKVHSFQEARGISGVKGLSGKVVDDFSSKIDLGEPFETVETIDANHMQMARCTTKDDPQYRAILGVLAHYIRTQLRSNQGATLETVQPSNKATPGQVSKKGVGPEESSHPREPLALRPATVTEHGITGSSMTLDPRDYAVAWIAPLEIEAQAALHMLDQRHRGRFPVSRGDDYVFHAGSMCGHNVVIATLPAGQEYGTGSAAALASQLKRFFPRLWFGLLVGVAAGLPNLTKAPVRDIRLGDVLVGLPDGESAGLVAYDLGKETEDGFQPLRSGYALAMTEPIVRSAIGSIKLEAPNDTELFLPYYNAIRSKEHATGTFTDPGQDCDKLYLDQNDGVEQAVHRERRPAAKRTRVWYGPIGSGEKLLKSAKRRNELRDRYGLIGLEMEAAGTMNRIPVGVVRGVCDYGDKHKNKQWQPYAAAMAAAYGKAILAQIPPEAETSRLNMQGMQRELHQLTSDSSGAGNLGGADENLLRPCYHIRLEKNPRFTGRETILDQIEEKFFIQKECRAIALAGLGGVGKTQVALQFAYNVKNNHREYSIFWVAALSAGTFEQALTEIANKLGVQRSSNEEDIKEALCRHLSSNKAGRWLFIVDNADDPDLVFGSDGKPGILSYLPSNEQGLTLLTTRSRGVAVDFAQSDVIDVERMDVDEATEFLKKSLIQKDDLKNSRLISDLLDKLAYLPLAIVQATAFLNQTKTTVTRYLQLMKGAENEVAKLFSREFRDRTRYDGLYNAVARTWLVSFEQIRKSDEAAVDLLVFLSCIEPKVIPHSILPGRQSFETESAVGILCGYSFLARKEDGETYDMHSLVHLAVNIWIEEQGKMKSALKKAISHLDEIFPSDSLTNQNMWREYLPHAFRMLNRSKGYVLEDRFSLLAGVGRCLTADRRLKEAILYHEEVYNWKRQQLSEDDSSRLLAEHTLASVYIDDRQILKAVEMFEHIVAISKKTLDEKDHDRLASEHELARAYLDNRQIEEAIEIFEHIVSIWKETLDEKDHPRLASEHELARAYLGNRQIEKATEMFEHIVAIRKETLDEKDHDRLTSEHELARAYLENRQIEKAIRMFEHIVAMRIETLDEKDHDRLTSEHELARAYLDNRQIEKAIRMFEHIVAIGEETLDEKDNGRLTSEHELARAYLDNKQIEKATEMFEHIVAIGEETLDERDHDRLWSEHELARAYLENSRVKEAIKILEHVVTIRQETLDEKDYSCLTSEQLLARAFLDDNQIQQAIDLLEHVVAMERELFDEDDPSRRVSVDLLRDAYNQLEAKRELSGTATSYLDEDPSSRAAVI